MHRKILAKNELLTSDRKKAEKWALSIIRGERRLSAGNR